MNFSLGRYIQGDSWLRRVERKWRRGRMPTNGISFLLLLSGGSLRRQVTSGSCRLHPVTFPFPRSLPGFPSTA